VTTKKEGFFFSIQQANSKLVKGRSLLKTLYLKKENNLLSNSQNNLHSTFIKNRKCHLRVCAQANQDKKLAENPLKLVNAILKSTI